MVRLAPERVLVIGDAQREVQNALLQALPAAQVTAVGSVFDGISEMAGGSYTTVIAAAEPIERRPEAAVRTLRNLAGDGRVILFGPASFELLSRKMLHFGCDDYILLPASAGEIQQIFGTPPLRLAGQTSSLGGDPGEKSSGTIAGAAARDAAARDAVEAPTAAAVGMSLSRLPLADVFLDALLQNPHEPVAAALRQLNAHLGPGLELAHRPGPQPELPPAPRPGQRVLSHDIRVHNDVTGTLHLSIGEDDNETAGRHLLAQIAHLVGKATALHDRHNRLQKLAITDELTGLYNARYFRHFLTRLVDKARQVHFPVTLLLFDIDDFKKYNDQYGHGVGDEILKETATLMRRCTRDHDLVARVGGDEFAVVFWDKEGPRQPREPKPGVHFRPPQTPLQIFDRFKKLLGTQQFPVLGQSGKGVLGISAGLAVYPYEASDAAGLIDEADRRLMHGAKRNGKNTIYIVGTDEAAKAL